MGIDNFYDSRDSNTLSQSASTSGVGSFIISNAEKGDTSMDDKNDDSDDEDEEEVDYDNPEFMDSYLAAMEEELGGTTMIDTFEKTSKKDGISRDSEEPINENGDVDL